MSLKERVDAFGAATREYFGITKPYDLRQNFGVSNGAKIVEGGLQLGVSNLEAYGNNTDQFVMGCMIRFPPEDEVYFAVQVKGDLQSLLGRLAAMKTKGAAAAAANAAKATPAAVAAGGDNEDQEDSLSPAAPPGEIAYSHRNNLAVIYLAPDGRLYLRNKQFWESLKFDLSTVGPGVVVDRAIVAVWPPAASARRSLLAREFVGYLGSLLGRDKVHEQRVWSDDGAASADMQRMPATIPIADIETAVSELGGHYPHGEVRRFHASLNFLNHKHFVILAGLSGTGKTQLALKYARAVHGVKTNSGLDPFLFVCPVRPEWTDPSGLTGYYDVLSDRYMVPPFLEAVLLATAHRDSPVFVVLDELNLARVEYYFSDVLSAVETGEPLQLHSSGVPLEGSTGVTVPASLRIPPNLYIVGTINVDETTNPVSDKVLDRAVVIDMSAVDLPGFFERLEVAEPDLATARAACEPALTAVHEIMRGHNLGFGYRVAEEVVRYHDFAVRHLATAGSTVTDELMVQKVLLKLRGGERQRALLTGLAKALGDLPLSQTYLLRLQNDLDEFGSFQAGR